ncbi:hypothetical protein EDB85DRAFT_252241 [Lactarius pseudohatsudake]|nr:hypothetical protein EDB85DRAFT_252241 [Lactarius pseudohatsudake]
MFPLRLAKVILTGTGILALRALAILSFRGPPLTLKSYRRRRVSEQAKTSLTTEMAEVLVKIVIVLLSILSITTKEVKRRRAKSFARKLLGRTYIENVLRGSEA